MVKLKDCCKVVGGATPKREVEEFWSSPDIPWVTPKDISKLDKPILDDAPEYISQAGYESCATYLLPKGSVLLTSRAPIGNVAIAGRPMCTNQGFKSLIPNKHVDGLYLYYSILNNSEKLQALGNGATFKEISKSIVEDFEIPLPPLTEQKRIAAILDKADAIRRKRQEAINLADEFLRAVFLDMFGDPVANTKNWPVKKWGDIGVIKIINGRNQSKVLDPDGEYPIIGSGGEMGRANNYLCPENTIVIGRKGNINKPLLIKEKFWNVDTAFGLVPNLKALSFNYLYWFCVFFDFERLNKTVTIPSLTKSDLLEIQIPLPEMSIQNKFDHIVEKINGMKVHHIKGLELSNNSFNALSNRLFTNEN